MTVVVMAKLPRGGVLVGADGRITVGDTIVPTSMGKVVEYRGGTVVGFTAIGPAYEALELLRHRRAGWTTRTYKQVLGFAQAFYDQLHELDSSKDVEAELLVKGTTGRLYYVMSKSSVLEIPQYYAIGSGGAYAKGVLWAEGVTKESVRRALLCAQHFSNECGEPLFIKGYYT